MNTTMAGGSALTAESDVSSVASAVQGPQSSSVGVNSGMLDRHMHCSGAHQHICLGALWNAFQALLSSSADRPLGVPPTGRASSCSARLPALHSQGRTRGSLILQAKVVWPQEQLRFAGNVPPGILWKLQ